MRKFLPIFIFFVFVFPVTVSAQEIPSSNATSDISPILQTVKPQGNIFSDIIDRLQNKQIYEEMNRINQSILPASVVIEDKEPPKVNKNNNQEEVTVETQVTKSDTDTIRKVAGQYAVGTGINTPYEVSKVSTNIFDWFGDILKSITDIFDRGNEEAGKFVEIRTPQKIQSELISKKDGDVTPTPYPTINPEGNFQTEGLSGFAVGTVSNNNMEKALSISRCSYLPYGICTDNNDLILEEME